MDFDGFLVQMRIEVEGVEQAAAPLWALAMRGATQQAPTGTVGVPAAAAMPLKPDAAS